MQGGQSPAQFRVKYKLFILHHLGTDSPFQAKKAINSMEQHEEPAGLTESGNRLHGSIADRMKRLPGLLTCSRIRGSKLQFVS